MGVYRNANFCCASFGLLALCPLPNGSGLGQRVLKCEGKEAESLLALGIPPLADHVVGRTLDAVVTGRADREVAVVAVLRISNVIGTRRDNRAEVSLVAKDVLTVEEITNLHGTSRHLEGFVVEGDGTGSTLGVGLAAAAALEAAASVHLAVRVATRSTAAGASLGLKGRRRGGCFRVAHGVVIHFG